MNIIKLEDIFKANRISINPVGTTDKHPIFFMLQMNGTVVEPSLYNELFKKSIHIYHPPRFNHLIFLK